MAEINTSSAKFLNVDNEVVTGKAMTEYRDGALACRAVLKNLSDTNWGGEDADSQYFEMRDAAIASILKSAGQLSSRAAGTMAVLAEFIVCIEQEQTTICLGSKWKPWAAMTADEQWERRDELAEI